MKDIKGFEGLYAITKDGRIWSYPRIGNSLKGRWRKFNLHRKGYYLCILRDRYSKAKGYYIHRLVADTYIKNPLNLKEINHKNCNKLDNRQENLEWCTHLDNMRHAYKNNLVPIFRGEKHGNSKLKNSNVCKIRELCQDKKMSYKEIGALFNVHKSLISLIARKKIWKHI
jgi:hypothetical protein